MNSPIFKIGDTVYDEINFPGKVGKVYEITESKPYPVRVKFDGEKLHGAYTMQGKGYIEDVRTILSHAPYEIACKGFSQKIEYNHKPFDKVLVRDPGWDEWKLGFFSHVSVYEGSPPKYFVIGGTYWAHCIPYEGNEHLFSREDSPF